MLDEKVELFYIQNASKGTSSGGTVVVVMILIIVIKVLVVVMMIMVVYTRVFYGQLVNM